MHCTKKITDDLFWVGGDDRRLAMFEGVYSVPTGVSYNSYLLMDESTVLFDTVDRAVSDVFFQNIAHTLGGRTLNFVVVHHMEPDHSGTLAELILRHPSVVVVCNQKTANMLEQFFELKIQTYVVDEKSEFCTGRHSFRFFNAPMVHWPEVMVSYDSTDKVLFSADAFGTFGALNGAMFADEVNFERDYLDELRRYYCNIVGKYGPQVQSLLKKVTPLDIQMICPLHGFVWRNNLGDILDWHQKWSTYTPEKQGVMIAYASVYGNTENTANIIACRLRDKGIPTVMFDVSVTHASEIIAAAFQYSHLIFASTTYNAGIFVSMEELLHDLVSHNIQNRTVALVENGSWAATSGKLMTELLSKCKNMNILAPMISLKSSLKPEQTTQVDALVDAIAADFPSTVPAQIVDSVVAGEVDGSSLFKLSYGLYVLTAREGEQDNGCIINTAQQISGGPITISVSVNKANLTHDMIARTGVFNLSVLDESAQFDTFKHFGFQSGRTANKFAGEVTRTSNGLPYLATSTSAVLSGRVVATLDANTHTVFLAEVTEAITLSKTPSLTYAYYFQHIKPKPPVPSADKKGFVCKICGYVHEGDTLPADIICPLCKHGAADFEPIS